jgi:erythronate-4-phosphate dehydrogenase
MTAGIIGYGHVGSRVAQLLEALGVHCVLNDPPLRDLTGETRFLALDEVMAADIVSLHVPLTKEGSYPTLRLLDGRRLARLKPNALVINTARGGVVDEEALIEQLDKRRSMTATVDCWAHEPAVNTALLQRVSLGTPHIAGYSFDGKVGATEMLYAAACEHFDLTSRWQAALPATQPLELRSSGAASDMEILTQIVLSCYDVREDSKALKRLLSLPQDQQPGYFDSLRTDYPLRREFKQFQVIMPEPRPRLEAALRALGFQHRVSPSPGGNFLGG